MHDYSAVDLIVLDKACRPKRVQVKYVTVKNGGVIVKLTTNINSGRDTKHIDVGKIDGWAVYISDLDVVAYVSVKAKVCAGKVSIFKLRTEPCVSPQFARKRHGASPLYSEFLNPEVLWQ